MQAVAPVMAAVAAVAAGLQLQLQRISEVEVEAQE